MSESRAVEWQATIDEIDKQAITSLHIGSI